MGAVLLERKARPAVMRTALKAAAVGVAAAALLGVVTLLDVQDRSLEMVPSLSSEMVDRIPFDLELPSSVDRVVDDAFDTAEGKWDAWVSAAQEAMESQGAFSLPLGVALGVMGFLHLAVFWTIRRRREVEP
ncbi:MAG: hypothetical protein ACYTHM_00395 [Planctomycetota bacterium]|jgi:hypothetical protein